MSTVFGVAAATAVLSFWLMWTRLQRRDLRTAVARVSAPALQAAGARRTRPRLIEVAGDVRGQLTAKLLDRLKLRESAAHLLEAAALKWGPAGLLHRSIGLFVVAFLGVTEFTGNSEPLIAMLAAAAAGWIPLWYVRRKARTRVTHFEEQFPDCLEFISRSMRAGHAFSVAVDMARREFSEPLAGEMRRAFEEQNLGQPLEIVLRKLAYRLPSMDVQFFVSAVLLQKRTGGNLAELLDKLANLMRERFKLRARIRAVSAQGLMSGRILSAIPAGVAVMMFVVNPKYARFFVEDPMGHELLASALALQLVGYLIIRKIVTFEV
jgi:tight adherence protein B